MFHVSFGIWTSSSYYLSYKTISKIKTISTETADRLMSRDVQAQMIMGNTNSIKVT